MKEESYLTSLGDEERLKTFILTIELQVCMFTVSQTKPNVKFLETKFCQFKKRA